MSIIQEDNRHIIPHIFKGLTAYQMAYALDTVFIDLLEDEDIDVPLWLLDSQIYWSERTLKYRSK